VVHDQDDRAAKFDRRAGPRHQQRGTELGFRHRREVAAAPARFSWGPGRSGPSARPARLALDPRGPHGLGFGLAPGRNLERNPAAALRRGEGGALLRRAGLQGMRCVTKTGLDRSRGPPGVAEGSLRNRYLLRRASSSSTTASSSGRRPCARGGGPYPDRYRGGQDRADMRPAAPDHHVAPSRNTSPPSARAARPGEALRIVAVADDSPALRSDRRHGMQLPLARAARPGAS
jgi:hypothetical protein